MPYTPPERAALIERYARGPALLKAALAKLPREAVQWKPAPNKWSAHEIVVHCSDSETNAHMRLRYLLAEPQPIIVGYDQERWAATAIVPGVKVDTPGHLIVAALMLGFVNAVIRPFILIFTLPLTVFTLGMFIFVVNGISLEMVAWVVPGFKVASFGSAILGSIVVGLTGWFASAFVGGSGRIERYRRIEVTGRRID